MFSRDFFIRCVVAVIVVVVVFALLPPLFRIFGLPITGDVMTVIKICVGAIAAFYVFLGPKTP